VEENEPALISHCDEESTSRFSVARATTGFFFVKRCCANGATCIGLGVIEYALPVIMMTAAQLDVVENGILSSAVFRLSCDHKRVRAD